MLQDLNENAAEQLGLLAVPCLWREFCWISSRRAFEISRVIPFSFDCWLTAPIFHFIVFFCLSRTFFDRLRVR